MACDCSTISAINYENSNEVILAVNSLWYAARWWLSQIGDDKKRYLSRYGSITFNEQEQQYSQAKLELYGLFRTSKPPRYSSSESMTWW